jgi:osmotically-inducible protein OsmY
MRRFLLNRHKNLRTAGSLAACALLTGFLIALLPATSSVFAATAPSASSPPADAQISATIRTKLAKSKIGTDGFKFRVEKGVVTWEGHTEVPQHKGAATRMARAAGAAQVINNIDVGAAGKAKAPPRHATVASQ